MRLFFIFISLGFFQLHSVANAMTCNYLFNGNKDLLTESKQNLNAFESRIEKLKENVTEKLILVLNKKTLGQIEEVISHHLKESTASEKLRNIIINDVVLSKLDKDNLQKLPQILLNKDHIDPVFIITELLMKEDFPISYSAKRDTKTALSLLIERSKLMNEKLELEKQIHHENTQVLNSKTADKILKLADMLRQNSSNKDEIRRKIGNILLDDNSINMSEKNYFQFIRSDLSKVYTAQDIIEGLRLEPEMMVKEKQRLQDIYRYINESPSAPSHIEAVEVAKLKNLAIERELKKLLDPSTFNNLEELLIQYTTKEYSKELSKEEKDKLSTKEKELRSIIATAIKNSYIDTNGISDTELINQFIRNNTDFFPVLSYLYN